MEYIATAHRPASVTHSVHSNLTSPDHTSLTIVRSASLEVHELLPSGPSKVYDVPLWGKPLGAATIIQPSSDLARQPGPTLFVLLLDVHPKCLLIVSIWNSETKTLDVTDRIEMTQPVGIREAEFWQGIIVDQERGCLAVGLWTGMITIIQLKDVAAKSGPSRGTPTGGMPTGGARRKFAAEDEKKANGLVQLKFDVQIKEYNLLSLSFLNDIDQSIPPTLLFLYLTPHREISVVSHTVSFLNKDLSSLSNGEELFTCRPSDLSSSHLIALPGGILIVGETELAVFDIPTPSVESSKRKSNEQSAELRETEAKGKGKRRRASSSGTSQNTSILPGPKKRESGLESDQKTTKGLTKTLPFSVTVAWDIIDSKETGTRILLGDSYGQLTLVHVKKSLSTGTYNDIETLILGESSPPTSVTSLPSSYVFIGSHFSSSQILNIQSTPDPSSNKQSYLSRPLSDWPNLAPALDFHLCGKEEDEEGKIVVCAGGMNKGALSVVQKGAGFQSDLEIKGLEGVSGIWDLAPIERDDLFLLALPQSTVVLQLPSSAQEAPSVLPSTFLPGLCRTSTTLASGPALSDCMIQITDREVLLVGAKDGTLKASWRSVDQAEIVAGAVTDGETPEWVVIALRGGLLVMLQVEPTQFCVRIETPFSSEISSVAITSRFTTSPPSYAVALWDLSLHLSTVPDAFAFTPSLVRSLLFTSSPRTPPSLLAGLADGELVVHSVELLTRGTGHNLPTSNGEKVDVKTIKLGQVEVGLTRQIASEEEGGGEEIFAFGERSAIIRWEDTGRLSWDMISIKDVSASTFIGTFSGTNSMLLATPTGVLFGKIDGTKRQNLQTIPFGTDNPYRIVYHPNIRAYGVAFIKTVLDRTKGQETMSSSFKVLDKDTFEPIFVFDLDPSERATALRAICFTSGSETRWVFVLGTGYLDETLSEVHKGRVIVFGQDRNGRPVSKLMETTVAGAVYAIEGVGELGFVASVNSRVLLFGRDLNGDTGTMYSFKKVSSWESSYLPSTLINLSSVDGKSRLAIGDAMSSLSVVEIDQSSRQFRTVIKDLKPLWLTTAERLGQGTDDTLIAADSNCNILTMQPEDHTLVSKAGYHVGELINKFAKGALLPNEPADMGATPNLVFGTSSGRISAVLDLNVESSRFLFDLQRNMTVVLKGFGNVSLSDYRQVQLDNATSPSVGVIDGDYVQSFLQIKDQDLIRRILDGRNQYEKIDVPYSEVCGILEGFGRLH
ncbi:Damage-specific DNA binding complex, subunit DDB1 [Phaffia rhodozyma]|uniref:Damage-specific DNA binding complex, subunit DDB1 n=1 Tax=Phaffia rhodozyma TaxID=264483 RepID=A0A0F7SVV1_PHARH|nr:Damage-specific DNA binding complex, subunit DDB1 [Phaffia rhodozyma]